MLSKYYSLIRNSDFQEDMESMSSLCLKLSEHIGTEIKPLSPGGTLGIFFECDIYGKRKFIKTHGVCDELRDNLIKEIEIMSRLYGNKINIESFKLDYNEKQQYVLVMDYLKIYPNRYSVGNVRELVNRYSEQMSNIDPSLFNYNQTDVINAALESAEKLYEYDLINKEVYKYCINAVHNFEYYYSDELSLCHGDLSNVNIANLNDELIAIDWEDALICVKDYDLLYWLTFFSQRKYYNANLFKHIGINVSYAKDIMVIVLIIKSYMSYMNLSYTNNSISINDRICEIIKI